jgi:pyrimidine 5'-nucleotidase
MLGGNSDNNGLVKLTGIVINMNRLRIAMIISYWLGLASTITAMNSNKTYEWILFDADETLFHFDAFSGLKLMFSRRGFDFTNEHYKEYEVLNKALWIAYQKHQISADELKKQRFDTWASRVSTSPEILNQEFLSAMAEICKPLDGALDLLMALQGRAKLGIVTNGFTELQQVRLEKTGFTEFFDVVVASEAAGIAKPHKGIFEHAFSLMGTINKERVLMIGDNLDSDIQGGINAGIDTCWLNVHSVPVPENIVPNYQVASHNELKILLMAEYQMTK